MNQQPKLNLDLKTTQPFINSDGNQIYKQGLIFRKVSKFLVGADEDALIPFPVFYDAKTGKILIEMLPEVFPKELIEEYKKYNEKLNSKNFQIPSTTSEDCQIITEGIKNK